MVTNSEFILAIFGDDAPFCHVTDFPWDPNNIPMDQHLRAWAGDWASRRPLRESTNQYFCVSVFNPDEQGRARRRKSLFLRARCVVLDDVREKLCAEEAAKLPPPSWILETSPGSEQWGYILAEPCTDRARFDNLQDGLVASGLSPMGTDPGQKGVTRYVRLPGGVNTKASKMINGQPWQCRLLAWSPWLTHNLSELAAPFFVDLDAPRRDGRVDGAADLPDHPILQIPDVIHIKDVRSDGRFDVTCPWVDEHTGSIDNGAAVFTNTDGSMGFKCHHGACEQRTARDLIRKVNELAPGWGDKMAMWKVARIFAAEPVAPLGATAEVTSNPLEDAYGRLRGIPFTDPEARGLAEKILRAAEDLGIMDQQFWLQAVADEMRWTKKESNTIIKSLRSQWYETKKETHFLADMVFVKSLNRIYEFGTDIIMSIEGFQNAYSHLDAEVRKTALVEGAVKKVDVLDFAPKRPAIFEEDGKVIGNIWTQRKEALGKPGDASPWLNHMDVMGWGRWKKVLLQFMAFTLLHPDRKINFMIILGGYEGSGKDFLLYPLVKAEQYTKIIHSEELESQFNDYTFGVKLLVINEGDTSSSDREGVIANKLKPLAAAPPEKIRSNRKNVEALEVRNLLSVVMTTNSSLPIRLKGISRRIFPLWSTLTARDPVTLEVLPEWQDYWTKMWDWMVNGGVEACIYYLRNNVDLSDFNPGAAPPVTDFMREMQESSKTLQQQTVEAYIRHGVGSFAQDLVTLSEMTQVLKAGAISQDYMYCDPSWFTPERINRIMKEIPGGMSIPVEGMRLWIVRNATTYQNMTTEAVVAAYGDQVKKVRSGAGVRLVSV